MMDDIRKKINQAADVIEQSKKDEAYKAGQFESTMAQLNEKYGIETFEAIESEIKKREKKKDAIIKEIEKDSQKLFEFEW
jgi:hypothetical protein